MSFLAQAQTEPFERIGESFRSQTSSGEPLLVILAVAAAVAGAGLLLAFALSARRAGPGRALFRELSRANGLSGRESRLLLDLALRVQPDDPPALFVRRSAFEAAAADAKVDALLVDALRRKLYGP